MDVKERIKKIQEYFKGMQVDESDGEQIIYVMVEFPPRWEVQPETPNKFDISIGQDGNIYYFCASLEQGFDVIFDAIEYNIGKMKVALERAQLFKQKAKELQDLFADENITIEILRSLDFTYKGKKKKTIMQPKQVEEPEIKDEIEPEEAQDNE